MRKTVQVKYLLDSANHFLAHTHESRRDARLAVAGLLETALFEAGAYQGYTHLESAGIQRVGGCVVAIADDSRRRYLAHPNLI